jgi:hypothetical protein
LWSLRSGDQRRRSAGACTEKRQGHLGRIALLPKPVSRSGQPFCEPGDVKPQFARTQVDLFLLRCQQIQEQGRPAPFLEDARHSSISWTVTTAATSVRKKHHAARVRNRNGKITVERNARGRYANWSFDNPVGAHLPSLVRARNEGYVSWGRMTTQPSGPPTVSTLAEFDARLQSLQRGADASDSARAPQIPMGQLFGLAKDFVGASPEEVEVLLDRPDHPPRVVAVSIMDFQARRKATSEGRRRELYDLYLRRHDRIDTWDLVDRAAPYVVGGYLWDKPREPLYRLAASPHWYERRTSIVSTWFFIRNGELDDTFRIAQILVDDPHDLVQKAVGGWIREAGKRDEPRLRDFLDRNAATMPRIALRYAIEHLPSDTRDYYLHRKKTVRHSQP